MTGSRSERGLATRLEIYRLRPWYHDFSSLGLKTDFETGALGRARRLYSALGTVLGAWGAGALATVGSKPRPGRSRSGPAIEKGARHPLLTALRPGPPAHRVNQRIKEGIVLPLLMKALAGLERPRVLDLFCADGYYSCSLLRRVPQATVLGIDLDPREVARARAAAAALGLGNAHFEVADALGVETDWKDFDLVLCLGGLYHLRDPLALLRRLASMSRRYLVVQTVVLAHDKDPDAFVSPAPGWRHGCRFSHEWLARRLYETGWSIVEETRAELPGNRQPSDRQSSFFLCRRAEPTGSEAVATATLSATGGVRR